MDDENTQPNHNHPSFSVPFQAGEFSLQLVGYKTQVVTGQENSNWGLTKSKVATYYVILCSWKPVKALDAHADDTKPFTWTVLRRYSEFEAVYIAVEESVVLPGPLSPLPPKYTLTSFQSKFPAKRQQMLEESLVKNVTLYPQLLNEEHFAGFLDLRAGMAKAKSFYLSAMRSMREQDSE